jgi:tetratricopeptide (TPR) repeat protein
MNDHPDSAYAILQKASNQDNKRDRAYYALLFSEAQYKVYIDAKSDSLINVAVDYFSDNKDREKNTRAMIYKGAIMNILGKDEEAMKWYKRAESNAAKDDYYNLGYSKMRIGKLYQGQFALDSSAIVKYKEALHYFDKLNNVEYQLECMCEIGGLYRKLNDDSAYYYINKNPLAELTECILNSSNRVVVTLVDILQDCKSTNLSYNSCKQSFCFFGIISY